MPTQVFSFSWRSLHRHRQKLLIQVEALLIDALPRKSRASDHIDLYSESRTQVDVLLASREEPAKELVS